MKFIPCDESAQVYNWQLTTKKSKHANLNVDAAKNKQYQTGGFKKLKK